MGHIPDDPNHPLNRTLELVKVNTGDVITQEQTALIRAAAAWVYVAHKALPEEATTYVTLTAHDLMSKAREQVRAKKDAAKEPDA